MIISRVQDSCRDNMSEVQETLSICMKLCQHLHTVNQQSDTPPGCPDRQLLCMERSPGWGYQIGAQAAGVLLWASSSMHRCGIETSSGWGYQIALGPAAAFTGTAFGARLTAGWPAASIGQWQHPPRRSLMPHCSTMCRASRVAFWRSLVAPDVTCMRAAELVPHLWLWREA